MGAVCGRPTKARSTRTKSYLDTNNNNNNDSNSKFKDIKEIPSDPSFNPAQALNNELSSPNRVLASNVQQDNKDLQDYGERRVTEEYLKDSFVAQLQGKETDRVVGDGLPKFSVRIQGTLPNIDQNPKGQTKPASSEPAVKPKSIVMPIGGYNPPNANYMSYGTFENQGNAQAVAENVFEAVYQDKRTTSEDYYLDMNEALLKKYEQFQNNAKLNIRSKSLGTGQAKTQSNLLEWSKLLQRHFTQEKSPANLYENKSKLHKAYKLLLSLDERNWYEEVVLLHKEKQNMSKATGNMNRLTFDRKIIQLQEQFRWFVSAVANTRLNPSNMLGVHEFPPYKVLNRKKGEKLDTSGLSLARGPYSVTGSDDTSEILSPVRSNHSQINHMSSARAQIGGFTYLANPPDPRENNYSDFPDMFSPAWQEGFVWKGVYLKLFSKTEAQQLKKELKVLKHMGIEYLQTETSVKFFEPAQSISLNPNESIEGTKFNNSSQTVSAILPLICTVESSSWVLLGTPIFPIKKNLADDNIYKLGLEPTGFLKNTFLLSNLTNRNFKVYYKPEENQALHTFGNIANSSAMFAGNNQNSSTFLLLSNVGKTMISLPKVNAMMIISQEINSNVSFLEYPRKGLEPEMIKKMLGYADEDIGTEALLVNRKNKNETWDRDSKVGHDLYFEVLRFKRGSWMMQMIYVASKRALPPTFVTNKRASDLLSHSGIKKMIEIKGNVLLFSYLPNTDSLIHPYFISEQTLTSSFVEEAPPVSDPKGSKLIMPNLSAAKPGNPSQLLEVGSFVGRESFARGSFNLNKTLKDEKTVQDYFGYNIGRSIDSIVDQLENTDAIMNFASLKELFHRKGVNMRFEWVVYAKLRRDKAKILVGTDILVRCMKKMLEEKTSKRLKYFRKQVAVGQMDPTAQKKKMEEIIQDKTDFFLEDFYKKVLCLYINALIRDNGESPESEANDMVFQDLATDLFLHRMRALDIARKYLSVNHFDFYLSAEITKTIVNIPCLHVNMFFDAISYHFQISLNYEIVRQVRNDKYINWVSNQGLLVKPTDLNILYGNDYYLTTYERCYLLLLKFLSTTPFPSENPIELTLPAALYKLRKPRPENELQMSSVDCFLYDYYEIPNLEILNDWVVVLESALNGLYTPDGQQNLLIEGYILQMVLAFFSEDNDNQLTRSILERINTFANTSPITSPELTIVIHTWYGILAESKLFVECEQSYSMALLILHKLYGDPRGRGGSGTPWELLITSRLSILSRLQGKLHDAEYSEELFDATLMTLRDNPANAHTKNHYIYNDPFRAFQSTYSTGQSNELSHLQEKLSLKSLKINDHPFPHWVNHLVFDETSAKIDTLNSTLQKTPELLKWMITYMPIFRPTGIRWDTAYLRDFFLSIMQSTFSNTTSVSSVSNVSMERGRDRSAIGLDLSANPRLSGVRSDRKGGGLVHVFEKDASTLSKREINGTVYSWGQNDKGQVGSPIGSTDEVSVMGRKKAKIYYPRRIITLKDTIIQSVACGHSHSMAITLDGQILAWGDNRHSQLGLGSKAPTEVYVPSLVPNLKDVANVSCGHEHTVALTKSGHVYSWGEGEEGLLGHGDTRPQPVPKRIEALRNMDMQAIACGGLHTLALTKQGIVYAWGKGEGGQLGIPVDQLTRNSADNHVYLTAPTRVRSTLDGQVVTQIACGDAHSLALTQKGLVYSWGYSYYGQLGLGITSENMDINYPCQVTEPTLVQKLSTIKITDLFAGATFSFFLSDKKELYGCGLNESNQLGIEKNVTKVGGQLERIGAASSKASESAYPKKLDCFTSMPVLSVACGEAHSLALVFCESSYMLFSWGLQKQGQLGIGEVQLPNSTPRTISFLQSVMAYSMGCGSFHSLVVLGEPSKAFRKEALMERLEKKSENRWMSVFFEAKGSYESMIEMALNNLDNIIPSEEGKIVNPKAIRKTPTQS